MLARCFAPFRFGIEERHGNHEHYLKFLEPSMNHRRGYSCIITDILSDLVSDLSFRQVSRNQLITADVADHRPVTAACHFLWHQVDRRSRSQHGTSNFSNALPAWTAHSNWPLGSAVLIALRASPVLVTSEFYGDQ